jgi:hypothetical protein
MSSILNSTSRSGGNLDKSSGKTSRNSQTTGISLMTLARVALAVLWIAISQGS